MPPPKLPQPSGAVHSNWWLGFFFLTSSPILDLEHFSQVILRIVLQIMPPQITPTIRCCSQQLMVGVFFLTSSPILDLEHFSQVILRIVLQIMPTPQNNPNHQVLFSESDGWVFFDLFSYSGLRAFFTSDFTNCTTDYALPKLPQPSGAVHSNWWLGFFFFLTSSPILDLEHFSQVILRIVLQIMPSPNYPNHQVLFTASDGWVFFWPLLLFWT